MPNGNNKDDNPSLAQYMMLNKQEKQVLRNMALGSGMTPAEFLSVDPETILPEVKSQAFGQRPTLSPPANPRSSKRQKLKPQNSGLSESAQLAMVNLLARAENKDTHALDTLKSLSVFTVAGGLPDNPTGYLEFARLHPDAFQLMMQRGGIMDKLFDLPPGLTAVSNVGGGDCMYLALSQSFALLNAEIEAERTGQPLSSDFSTYQNVSCLDTRAAAAGGVLPWLRRQRMAAEDVRPWPHLKIIIQTSPPEGPRAIEYIEKKGKELYRQSLQHYENVVLASDRPEEVKRAQTKLSKMRSNPNRAVQQFERLALEGLIAADNSTVRRETGLSRVLWGDNIYLNFILNNPSIYDPRNGLMRNFPYHRLCILVVDRLSEIKNTGRAYVSTICVPMENAPSNLPNGFERCMWIILIRTRTSNGAGGMHYELGMILNHDIQSSPNYDTLQLTSTSPVWPANPSEPPSLPGFLRWIDPHQRDSLPGTFELMQRNHQTEDMENLSVCMGLNEVFS